MEVKLVARTLDLFELFAHEQRPLSLTELSRGLDVPMSSTLALVRTLTVKGYLYEIRRRGGYYPTRKMGGMCSEIEALDPLLEMVRPFLVGLRDKCGETVVIGKRAGIHVIYLDVVHSLQAIRYTSLPGDLRPIQFNSIGKVLFSVMDADEQRNLISKLDWPKITPRTLASKKSFMRDIEVIRERGWASNLGESVPDLAAIAMAFELNSEHYGVSIVGPIARMEAAWDAHVRDLKATLDQIDSALATAPK